jgi:hypothetical protein
MISGARISQARATSMRLTTINVNMAAGVIELRQGEISDW